MNLTNSTIIPNSPTRPNLKSPKVVTPYLHQLPYISKRITSSSPRTPRLKDQETQNLSRELSRENFHNRNLSNISEIASRSSLQKYLSPKKGTLESLKSPRSRISLNFKPRESNPVVSQVAKGELMKVLPQMKLKTLRDKMLVLSKIHEKMEAEKPVASRVIDENANSRRRSIIPMDQQEYKSPPDFLENLQDCLFTFKKNKLLQVDTPADSASAIHGMSFVSPRVFNQSTRADNPISQSQIDFKNSTIFKTPAPQSTKSKDLAASTIKLKSELEISQEASSNNVNETIFKGHHTRGHSWGQALGKLQIDEKDFGRIPTNKPYEIMSARKHNRQYSCRNLVRDAKQEMRQKSEFEKFSSQRATPVNAPSESTIKLPSVSGNLAKSTTSFNLRLDDSQKKEEGPAPSTESRKNALLSTECGSTTKRRKSFEKQKKEAEDQELDIFNLGHFIKDSAKKQPVKKEHNVSVLNMENQINLLKRSIGPKKDTSAANHSKKHSRRNSQEIL